MRQEKHVKKKRGFTFIELMAVLTIMGILVLMAAPRFLNRADQALEVNIRNNVMLVESKVGETLILNRKRVEEWQPTPKSTLRQSEAAKELYDRRGLVDGANPLRGNTYRIVPGDFVTDEARGHLDGTYYTNENGVVYYTDGAE